MEGEPGVGKRVAVVIACDGVAEGERLRDSLRILAELFKPGGFEGALRTCVVVEIRTELSERLFGCSTKKTAR